MVTEARARQVLQEGKIAAKRAVTPARRPSPKGAASARSLGHRRLAMLVGQGTVVGCTVLVMLMLAHYFFGGSMRATIVPPIGLPGTEVASAPGRAPTLFYRDRGDGTVLVMEIDAKGTRIKGIKPKSEVPMFEEPHHNNRKWDPDATSAQTRINALGSAFR